MGLITREQLDTGYKFALKDFTIQSPGTKGFRVSCKEKKSLQLEFCTATN